MKLRLLSGVIFLSLSIYIILASSIPAGASEEDPLLYNNFVTPVPQVNSFMGALQFDIPIEVPPGRSGMQPKIALTYNSYQKNGWIGMGWNIDAGAIQRSTKRGVDYNACDFAVGGQDLVPVDIDGSCNGLYQAKIEGAFNRFQFDHETGWVVNGQDGKKIYYGQDNFSRQNDPGDSSHVFKWCQDKVVDSNGNYMTMAYEKDLGQIYLKKIEYTGNEISSPALPAANAVIFHLEVGRTDINPMYTTKFEVVTAKRLKSIEIKAQNQPVRAYEFTYTQSESSLRSLLQNVVQFDSAASVDVETGEISGGTALPPINFDWLEDSDGTFTLAGSVTPYPTWHSATPGDFNGDGQTDFMINTTTDGVGWYVYLSNGNGTFTLAGSVTPYPRWHSATPGDFNGDGLTDFMINTTTDGVGWYVYLSNGDGTFTLAGSVTPYPRWHSATPGDFNGDGLTDFMINTTTDGAGWYVYLSNGDGTFTLAGSVTPYSKWNSATPADFNGDGLTDFIINTATDGSGWYVYLSNGDGTFRFTSSFAPYQQWHSATTGDFNGDGQTDFMINTTTDGAGWYVYLSNGNGTFTLAGSVTPYPTWHSATPGDFNGDGLTDFMINTTTDGAGWYVYLSNGDATFRFAGSVTPYAQWNSSRSADFNGDGKSDIMINTTTDGAGWYVYLANSPGLPIPDLLSALSNASGLTHSIEYANSSSYDNTRLPFIVHPVKNIITEDGNGILSKVNYAYQGGLFDYSDRSFRGFKKITRTNDNGTTQKTVFYQGNPEVNQPDPEDDDPEDNYFLKGRPRFVETRESTGGSRISHTDFTYGQRNEGHGSSFVYLDKKVSQNFESGQLVVEAHEDPINYDAVGHLEQAEFWDTDGTAEKITKSFTYANIGTSSEPRWRKTWEQVQGETGEVVRQTWYRYTNDGRANLEEKEFWHEEGNNPILKFEYDAYGNIWKEWDAKNQLIAEYTYDSDVGLHGSDTHTYPVLITNALGHTLGKTYDPRFGTVKTATDANGNTTYYDYDEFGRPRKIDLPTGGHSIVEYHDDSFPCWIKKRVLESSDPVSYIDTYKYFDGLGRAIQTVSLGEGGDKLVVTRIVYDEMGRQKEVVGPFFVAGLSEGVLFDIPAGDVPKTWTDYDLRSRPETTYALDGQFGTISSHITYNGLSTTVTDADNSQKTTTMDYLGRVKEVVEHTDSGDIHTKYTYNAAGDLTDVEDDAGNIIHVAFDTLGRKINMTDPDMGFWEYRYDANGNLEWQKDANNREIQIQYDVLDRITAKNYLTPTPDDHNVAYTYDDPAVTQANPLGRLSRETNGVVTTTYNSYDELGQVLGVSKSISGDATRTTQFAYDLSGKLNATIYPDNYQVNTYYYAGTGLVQSVVGLNDMKSYMVYSDYLSSGKIHKGVFGNGVQTTYSYDPFSTRMAGIQMAIPGSDPIIDRSYTYTRAGDIESIDDAVMGNTRYYEYDRLHRLVHEYSSINDYTDLTPSVLGYSYDPNKPLHGVGTIDSLGTVQEYVYDANGNMTSMPDLSAPNNPATRTITYNTDNMPATIVHSVHGTTSFTYDSGGSRAKKSGPNGTIYYYGALFENNAGQTVKYIFAGSHRVAMIKGGQTYYFHKDHLGSSSVITDESGAKVQEEEYLPFGGRRGASAITVSNFGFTDQEKDPETGLYNYNARFYDPALGVFTSADSIVPDPGSSQAYNRYAYCVNNPLIYTDPSGQYYEWISAAISGVIGAISAGSQSDWDSQAMIVGGVIGAVSGYVGAVGGEWAGGYFGSELAASVIGSSLGSATNSGLTAAYYGENVFDATLTGAYYGAVKGLASYVGSYAAERITTEIKTGKIDVYGKSVSKKTYVNGKLVSKGGLAHFHSINKSTTKIVYFDYAVKLTASSVTGGVLYGSFIMINDGEFGDGFLKGAFSAGSLFWKRNENPYGLSLKNIFGKEDSSDNMQYELNVKTSVEMDKTGKIKITDWKGDVKIEEKPWWEK